MKIKDKIVNIDDYVVYNKPNKVYIPLISGKDTNITVLVNVGEYVYKGSILGKRKGNSRIPIHSSISGTVIDFVEMNCYAKKPIKCVVIENDFKEKIVSNNMKKKLSDYSYDTFISNLKESGIFGLGTAGIATYTKYENKKIKRLIINATEYEPYVKANSFILNKRCEEILETIDAMIDYNKLEEAIIVLTKDQINEKKLIDNFIGTYLKIKVLVIEDFYPCGHEKVFIKKVLKDSKDIVVENVSTIYAIYESLKFNKPLIERVVTIANVYSGDCVNVLVKNGTLVDEILKISRYNDGITVLGGPMTGKKIKDNTVYSLNISCITKCIEFNTKPSKCISCGKCSEVCPMKLSPSIAVRKRKKILGIKRCIECGLCSYICPSSIDVREIIIDLKRGA